MSHGWRPLSRLLLTNFIANAAAFARGRGRGEHRWGVLGFGMADVFDSKELTD